MKNTIIENFLYLWKKYFKTAELPIACFYSDELAGAEWAEPVKGHGCFINDLAKVRKGESLAFNESLLRCAGAKRFLGFNGNVRKGFEYFLSTGNEFIEGERYLKSPDMVLESLKNYKQHKISGSNLIFKRWDNLKPDDEPEIIIFFAKPDVLSGLFTLANYDKADGLGVITPFSAGCGSIVHIPYLENESEHPRAVIGMFDPSARPCVPKETLSFAVPFKRFLEMVNNIEESFLITGTWSNLQPRIENGVAKN